MSLWAIVILILILVVSFFAIAVTVYKHAWKEIDEITKHQKALLDSVEIRNNLKYDIPDRVRKYRD